MLSPSVEVLYTEDGCPMGRVPTWSCKHIAAFCYALEEFVRLGFTQPFLSCKSHLQTWNQPWEKNWTPKPSTKYHFERAEYGKVKKAHPTPFSSRLCHPCETLLWTACVTLKLVNLCKGLSKQCAFLKVLNSGQRGAISVQQVPNSLDSHTVNQTPCPIPVTSFSPFKFRVIPFKCRPLQHFFSSSSLLSLPRYYLVNAACK